MNKIIIVLSALVACAVAKPGVVAPLAYSTPFAAAYAAPYAAAYAAPLAYTAHSAIAAPLAYANAHLDAATASSRVDLRQNYNAAVLNAAAPLAVAHSAPVAARVAAPLAAVAPVAAVAAPLTYVNAHLDAATASSRVDLRQNYNAAFVPATYAAAPVAAPLAVAHSAPVAAAPLAVAHSAPVAAVAAPLAYANAHLDAATASSRVDLRQNYNAAIVPATYAATPLTAPIAPVAPIKYAAAW